MLGGGGYVPRGHLVQRINPTLGSADSGPLGSAVSTTMAPIYGEATTLASVSRPAYLLSRSCRSLHELSDRAKGLRLQRVENQPEPHPIKLVLTSPVKGTRTRSTRSASYLIIFMSAQ